MKALAPSAKKRPVNRSLALAFFLFVAAQTAA